MKRTIVLAAVLASGCLGALQGGTVGGGGVTTQTLRPLVFRTCEPGMSVAIDGALVPPQAGVTDANGIWGVPAVSSLATAFNLHITKGSYAYQPVVALPPGNHDIFLNLACAQQQGADLTDARIIVLRGPPVFVPLPALRARGEFFEQVDGTRWRGIETSAFDALDIWQNQGPAALEPFEAATQQLGFNIDRVWTRFDAGTGAGSFQNLDYSRVGAFLDYEAAHGKYVDLTAYTGAVNFTPDHWDRLCAAVQGHTNVLLSLVNENDQPSNWIDISPFKPCPGVLSSPGSNGSGSWPPTDAGTWDWSEAHYNADATDWMRKAGHDTMEIAEAFSHPAITNEDRRDDQDANLYHFYDAARGCMLVAGCAFHSLQGKVAQVFTGNTLLAAMQHVAGMLAWPLSCQGLPYVHRQDQEAGPPPLLRFYQMDNDPACVAPIRP